MIGVREQDERQIVFGFEFKVRFCILRADAQDHRVFFGNVHIAIAKATRLRGAAGRVVFGIKIQDDALAAKIRKFYLVPVFIGEREIRRRAADMKCLPRHRVLFCSFVKITNGARAEIRANSRVPPRTRTKAVRASRARRTGHAARNHPAAASIRPIWRAAAGPFSSTTSGRGNAKHSRTLYSFSTRSVCKLPLPLVQRICLLASTRRANSSSGITSSRR